MRLGSHGIFVPGLGTGIKTDALGTLGSGTNIAGIVPGQKSLGLAVPSHAHPWRKYHSLTSRVSI